MVQTQYSSVIKVLRSDNGGEYINFELSEFLRGQRILHETTCPHTPQQNGVAERKNRHILETARALLLGASVPPRFWPEAVTYVVYVINRMPSRVVGFQTPIQVLTQHTPVVSSNTLPPRVFGCVAYVHIQKIHRSKLDPCALRCVFVGYSSHQKGYKCYHPETRHMYVTMDVTFSETEYFYTAVPSTSDHQGENTDGNLSWLDLGGDVTVEQRVEPGTEPILEESQQATIEKDPVVEQPCAEPSIPSLSSSEVPPNTSSLNMPEVSIVNDCVTNPSVGTYKLPPRQNRGVPPDRFSPEGKVKYPIANYVSCNKLAPERQTLVSNMESIHVPTRKFINKKVSPKWAKAMDEEMLALQKNNTWYGDPHQSLLTYLGHNYLPDKYEYKARLVAKGYTQTYGVDYQETFSPVAKMNTIRVLISLAANMDWPLKQFDVKNAFLHGNLEEEVYMDFPPGYSNGGNTGVCRLRKSLYGLKQSPRAWFGNDVDEMSKLQGNLAVEFEMKDLGDLKYFLGVEFACSSKGIFLSQRKYQELVDKGRYQRLVGRLIYLAHTRLDIAYYVSIVSQFMHSSSVDHMAAVMRILAYLKSALGKGVLHRKNGHLRIEGLLMRIGQVM
ncbi:unnamed protein product [Prunus brigantina]